MLRAMRNCGQGDANCVRTFDALHSGLCKNDEDLPIWSWFSSTSQVTMMPDVQLCCDGGWIPTMLIVPLCVAMACCPGSSSSRLSASLRFGNRAVTALVFMMKSVPTTDERFTACQQRAGVFVDGNVEAVPHSVDTLGRKILVVLRSFRFQ